MTKPKKLFYFIMCKDYSYCVPTKDLKTADPSSVKLDEELNFKYNHHTKSGRVMFISASEDEVLSEIDKEKKNRVPKEDSFHEEKPRKSALKQRELMSELQKKPTSSQGNSAGSVGTKESKKAAKKLREEKKATAALSTEMSLITPQNDMNGSSEHQENTNGVVVEKLGWLSDNVSSGSTQSSPSSVEVKVKVNKADDVKDVDELKKLHDEPSFGQEEPSDNGAVGGASSVNHAEENSSGASNALKTTHDTGSPSGSIESLLIKGSRPSSRSSSRDSSGSIKKKEAHQAHPKHRSSSSSSSDSSSSSSSSSSSTSSSSSGEKRKKKKHKKNSRKYSKSKKAKKSKKSRKSRKRKRSRKVQSDDTTESDSAKKCKRSRKVKLEDTSQSDTSIDDRNLHHERRKRSLVRERTGHVRRNLDLFPGIMYNYFETSPDVVKVHKEHNVYIPAHELERITKESTSVPKLIKALTRAVFTREALRGSTAQGYPNRIVGRERLRQRDVQPRLDPEGRDAILKLTREIQEGKKSWRPRVEMSSMSQAFTQAVRKIGDGH